MIRINLWSSPRNVSTALMYSFAQRPDATVVDEPLYAYYLNKNSVEHPGQQEILQSQSADLQNVINEVLLANYTKPVAFFKQMTHHLYQTDLNFIKPFKNIIFIRDPRLIIRSYSKVRNKVTMQDIGIAQQLELLHFLKEDAIVLDSKFLLQQPKICLTTLCERLSIPFYKEMLQWPAGARKEDGVWAKYWYSNVHQSTGFKTYEAENFTLSDELEKLAEECLFFYEKLKQFALK